MRKNLLVLILFLFSGTSVSYAQGYGYSTYYRRSYTRYNYHNRYYRSDNLPRAYYLRELHDNEVERRLRVPYVHNWIVGHSEILRRQRYTVWTKYGPYDK